MLKMELKVTMMEARELRVWMLRLSFSISDGREDLRVHGNFRIIVYPSC